ncbi:hypothetical protein D3C83_123590 [compost metagenome]
MPEATALEHAEAVLLIDDDEAEAPEVDPILEQRVRSHENVEPPFGELREHGVALARAAAAGQGARAAAERNEPLLE